MEHVPYQSINPSIYLKKFSKEIPLISSPIDQNLGIIVVIPSYGETHLPETISSLYNTVPPECKTEVIVVVNDAENSPEGMKFKNIESIAKLEELKKSLPEHLGLEFIILTSLPYKKSGVGVARKAGMDEAVRRFANIKKNGIIVCLDADCKVESNYFIAIEQHFFFDHPQSPGADIYYEHPIDLKPDSNILEEGIILYELHLRYFVHCQEYALCPYAYQTVGSSMAVRSEAYQKQGGMNTRKAGEDFYFLHKIIALGNFTSLTNTRVIPSPRISSRVPFGTGKAQNEFVEKQELLTYDFNIFKTIKSFTSQFGLLDLQTLKKVHPKLKDWLELEGFEDKLKEIKENTRSNDAFTKRLWQWFNAFKFMKLTHYLRDELYPNVDVTLQASTLLNETHGFGFCKNAREPLLEFRRIDRNT